MTYYSETDPSFQLLLLGITTEDLPPFLTFLRLWDSIEPQKEIISTNKENMEQWYTVLPGNDYPMKNTKIH